MKLFDRMRQQKLLSVTLMVFTLSVGVLIGTLLNTQVHAARSQAVAPDATPLTVPKAIEAPNEFTKIAKALEPSVVYIAVTMKPESARNGKRGAQPQEDDGDDDGSDLFRKFFGQGTPFGGNGAPGGGQAVPPQGFRREASGTGFIVDRNGQVPKLVIATPSGSESLDRAAVAGISASVPFPPLPSEYKGQQIRLQFAFKYNVK